MNGKEESRVNTLWPFRFDDQLADWLQVHTPGCSIVARLTATTHATSRYGNEPGIVGGRESSFFKVFSHLSLLLSSPPPLPPSIFFQEFGKRRGGCRPFYLFLCIWRSCFRFFFFFDIFSSSLFLFYHVLFFWRGEGGGGGAAETVSRLRGPSCGFGFFRWVGAQWFLPILRFFLFPYSRFFSEKGLITIYGLALSSSERDSLLLPVSRRC